MKKTTKSTKKIKIRLNEAIFHVFSNYNNTIISVSDFSGNVIVSKSSGVLNFNDSKKSSPFAAKIVVEECINLIKPIGVKSIIIKTKGIGPGIISAVKVLKDSGFKILQQFDVTPIPFNGCRPKKRNRI